MREIKFRAWDKINKEMIDPVEVLCTRDISEFELMQFTSLKDKNGKEIYEGDVIQNGLYGNCIIVWNASICAFQYAYHALGSGTSIGGRVTNTLYEYDSKEKYEVIGNIYEHPELLNPVTP